MTALNLFATQQCPLCHKPIEKPHIECMKFLYKQELHNWNVLFNQSQLNPKNSVKPTEP